MKKRLTFFTGIVLAFFAAAQVQLTNIPTIFIHTNDNAAVSSKDYWVNGAITILSKDTNDLRTNDSIQIKGRGNSTWGMPKKPYRIKFYKKRHLLGMKDDAKNWVLLANYADKSLIRNALAFDLGNFIGMEFSPSVRFADVYLNNSYLGNYLVTDRIEVGKNRVNVQKMEATDVADTSLTGGYLFQQDGFNTDEDVYFFTNKNVPFSVADPDSDVIQNSQLTYLKNYLNYFESTLFSAAWKDTLSGYRPLIDTTSFLNWYIASEMTGNVDCFWSTYMYKKRNDMHLYYGPLWDYDIAFDNDSRKTGADTQRMLSYAFNNKTWINQQAMDPWFKRAVNRRWKQILASGLRAHMQAYIDSVVNLISESRVRNYEKWPTIGKIVYNEWYTYPTYKEYITRLKNYIDTRVDFLTTSFAADSATVTDPTSPFIPEPYYYRILNKAASLPMDVQNLSTAQGTRVILYTNISDRVSQYWKMIKMTDGSYQIINKYTGLAIASNGLNRTALMYTPNTTDTKQRWKVVPMELGGGTYRLVNMSTGNQLENTNGSTASGTLVNEQTFKSESGNNAWLFQKTVQLETGLDQPVVLSMEVWPNPAYEQLHLELNGSITNGRVEVFNLQGSCLLRQNVDSQETLISVRDFAEGVYILKYTAGNICRTIKFTVRH